MASARAAWNDSLSALRSFESPFAERRFASGNLRLAGRRVVIVAEALVVNTDRAGTRFVA